MTLGSDHIARDEDGKFSSYAWPGGYPVYHTCADGGTLCPDCANDPANPIKVGKLHVDMGGCADAGSTTLSWDHSLNVEDNHRKAAEALRAKLGWDTEFYGKMHMGSLPGAGYAFVFEDKP